MSDPERRMSTAEKVAAKKNQQRKHVPTSETFAQARNEMGKLTIYMRKALIEELKTLAFEENRGKAEKDKTSVSKILSELGEERVAAGPRQRLIEDTDPDFGL